MARIRTIKPDFWESQKAGKLSSFARLSFVGLISLADDQGRGRGDPGFLFGRLHPYSNETLDHFRAALDELGSSGLAIFYTVEGFDYYFLPGFVDNQRIDKPQQSKLPPPTTKRSKNVPRTFQERSKIIPGSIGEEGKGKEGKVSIIEPSAPAVAAKRTPIQIVVDAYKEAKNVGKDDKDWDRSNYPRCAKAAKRILDCFNGDAKVSALYVIGRGDEFDAKNLSWTLETIGNHAWDNERGKFNGQLQKTMGTDTVLGEARLDSSTKRGGQTRSAGQIVAAGILPQLRHDADEVSTEAILDRREDEFGRESEPD